MIMHGGVAPEGSNMVVPAISALVKRLAGEFDITVYTPLKGEGRNLPFMCGGARVQYLRAHAGDALPGIVAHAVRAVRRDHDERPFDLVHGFWALPGGLAAVLAAMATGSKSVVSLLGGEGADLPSIGYGNMRSLLPRAATLWTVRRAGAVTFLTDYQRDRLRRRGFTRTDDVSVIPFGADPEVFPFVAERPEAPPFRILNVSHLNSVKDQWTLLKAFWRLSRELDCRLRIIGEGSQRATLEHLARNLGITGRVEFAGYVPHEELPRHFGWAHILLHTSLYEGQGVVFAEAAASGVPVCGTRVGLLSDLGDPFAVTVEPGDDSALAESASRLLQDTARRRNLATRAHSWAQYHSADWTAGRFAEVYTGLHAEERRIRTSGEMSARELFPGPLSISGDP